MSLKEIRLIRLLVWILLYLLLLFLLIFAVVIPVVKQYKSVNKEHAEQKAHFLAARSEYETLSERLKELRVKHRKAIEAFENPWSEERFLSVAKRYFLSVNLMPVETNESDPSYRIYEINAKAKMESPQNFYRFLEALPTIPHAIQADFPIAFRSEGRDRIEGIFRIRVYEEKRESAESNASRQSSRKR